MEHNHYRRYLYEIGLDLPTEGVGVGTTSRSGASTTARTPGNRTESGVKIVGGAICGSGHQSRAPKDDSEVALHRVGSETSRKDEDCIRC